MQKVCQQCENLFDRPKRTSLKAFEKRIFCSNVCRGKSKVGSLNGNFKGGKSNCVDCSKELSVRYSYRDSTRCKKCWHKHYQGSRTVTWQGGKTKESNLIRSKAEYKKWRKNVFERDNYTCQSCGDNRGGNLNADHIKPFALYPSLRLELDNGRTLCIECHKQTETWGYGTARLLALNNQT